MSASDRQRGAVRVLGARTHNLRDVSCEFPVGAVTVVTGPSGAGKSSLVFDTLYAEGQRRYAESMSTYAQQFIQQLDRPPVEAIENLPPAIALEAKNSITNARSTVGTLTEIHDLLRLLFTYVGEVSCPAGHGPARRSSPEEIGAVLAKGGAGEEFLVVAPVERPGRRAGEALTELVRQGHFRMLVDGEIERLEEPEEWPESRDPLLVVVGRFRSGPSPSARLRDAVEEALRLGNGRLRGVGSEATLFFGRRRTCAACGRETEDPVPPLFSFNSPLGACPECEGFGRVTDIDPDLVVPDPSLSLEERPIAPWNSKSKRRYYRRLYTACEERDVPLDVPWEELDRETREWIWAGGKGFTGIRPFFRRLQRKKYKVHVRVLLARYRGYYGCPECEGTRLQAAARRVTVGEKNLPELTAFTVEHLREWFRDRDWSDAERARSSHIVEAIDERLEVLHRVGLDYLTLDRTARTLSGGESQRIHLSAALASGLTGTLYALDEPTVGLHARDSKRLLGLLGDLASRGNTVVVVEHDPTIIRGADRIVELGPGAGENGGSLIFEGTAAELLETEASVTSEYLRRNGSDRGEWAADDGVGSSMEIDELTRRPRIEVRGATAHNLRGIDVEIPLGALTAVTGVSGSGKSTLVDTVLYDGYRARQGEAGVEPGPCETILGLEAIDGMELVDQRSIGRSSRSIPVTYVKAYGRIRKLFAETEEAQRRGLSRGHFSFNVDEGRCPVCQGTGEQEIDLQFMGTVSVLCERCGGRRFRPEVLKVRLRGRSIAETLDMTVSETLEVFADDEPLCRRLRVLETAGLGYLRLGQPTSTLSSGEAQRLKLAEHLKDSAGERPKLLLFDEPTTGLHVSDVDVLATALERLVDLGHGVVVVEHQLDLVARSDWIVDLGPGGGHHGGEVLFCGPMRRFLDEAEGPTADELRDHLRRRRAA